MYRILIFIMLVISSSSTKFCVNCKHFIPNNLFFFNGEFGKCSVFPQEHIDNRFLVTGDEKYVTKEFYYCNTARNVKSMCGKEGKYYEEK